MKIELIALGKIKTPYIKDGVDDYIGRLRHYTFLSVTEIPDEPITKGTDAKRIIGREGDRIMALVEPQDLMVVWDEKGTKISSEGLADFLRDSQNQAIRKIAMVIGGALGLDKSVANRANKVFSLSAMTLPHQLARLIILEQIYRAFTIIKGEPYHTVTKP